MTKFDISFWQQVTSGGLMLKKADQPAVTATDVTICTPFSHALHTRAAEQ
jgi:hypothetical protein